MRRQDLALLLSSLVVVTAGWAFIEVADEVLEGDSREVDRRILLALRNPADLGDPVGPLWVEEAFRDITALGSAAVLTLLGAAVVGFLAMRRQYDAIALLVAAVVGGALLSWALKEFFARPRPDLVPHIAQVTSPSFPSGHSLLAVVMYLTLGSLVSRLVEGLRAKIYVLSVGVTFAFLVGVSRVYIGVHYPTDVLAGWTVGLIWALVCWLATRHLQRIGIVKRANES